MPKKDKRIEGIFLAFLPRNRCYIVSISKDIERDWKGNVDIINKYSVNELQAIEEYRMVFSTDGKSITLKSKNLMDYQVL